MKLDTSGTEIKHIVLLLQAVIVASYLLQQVIAIMISLIIH